MNLTAQFIPSDLLLLANCVFGWLLWRALRAAAWRKLLDNGIMVHALVGLLLGTFLFWQFNVGVRPGYNFHILGGTLFMLMFGAPVATVSLALVMLATWLRTGAALATLGINGLLMIVLPVQFTAWLLRYSRRHLPKNLFLFVLWNGFFCSMLTIILVMLCTALLLLVLGSHTWADILHYYLVATPILMFTEGFLSGMLITAFTVFQPEAVLNFNDEEYLAGK